MDGQFSKKGLTTEKYLRTVLSLFSGNIIITHTLSLSGLAFSLIIISGDMAVVLGNLALSLDIATSRTVLPDRKTRPATIDAALGLNLLPPRRSEAHALSAFFAGNGKGFESDGEARSQRVVVVRGKANSKANGVDSDEENGNEEWEEDLDWEKEMRRRVKEIEERKELEKKAEELQSRMEDGKGDGDGGETEEEKRMRVRKELEKVRVFSFSDFVFIDS